MRFFYLFSISVSLLQEKDIYRWPIRESLKSMLAMGWSIDRTKDGESMSQQRETEKMRKISQASQVRCRDGKCFQRFYGEKLLVSSTAVVANLLSC